MTKTKHRYTSVKDSIDSDRNSGFKNTDDIEQFPKNYMYILYVYKVNSLQRQVLCYKK